MYTSKCLLLIGARVVNQPKCSSFLIDVCMPKVWPEFQNWIWGSRKNKKGSDQSSVQMSATAKWSDVLWTHHHDGPRYLMVAVNCSKRVGERNNCVIVWQCSTLTVLSRLGMHNPRSLTDANMPKRNPCDWFKLAYLPPLSSIMYEC